MIIDKLIEKIITLKNPGVIGLDPKLKAIPEHIKNDSFSKKGETPQGTAEAIQRWAIEIIDNIYDIAPAVKPQIAMYEMYGAYGIEAYINVVKYAKSKGLIVIGDTKRNDISSSAECYAEGHLGSVSIGKNVFEIFEEDFLTVNPYLGFDSIEPFVECCKQHDKGLFVLVKTSNPGSNQFQNLRVEDGRELYLHVGQAVNEWGQSLTGKYGYSAIGAVVGATHPSEAESLRKVLPNTFFLMPGYGAQGAKVDDIKGLLSGGGLGAIINSSRGITEAYMHESYSSKYSPEEFGLAARSAALDMKNELSVLIEGSIKQ